VSATTDHAAPHQQAEHDIEDGPADQQPASPQAPEAGRDHQHDEQRDGEQRPPLLVVGVAAEQDEAALREEHRPAGALAFQRLALLRRREEQGVGDRPAIDAEENLPDGQAEAERHQAVVPIVEEMLLQPLHGLGAGRGSEPAGEVGVGAHRVTSAILALYQLSNAEMPRLTSR
jgi:hypothetical protein